MANDQVNGVPEGVDLPPLGPVPNKVGISLWFGRVTRELEQIESDISSKQGFLIFKSHTYSKTELRQHPSFRLTEALVDQIGHNVTLWEREGKLSGPERALYIKCRTEAEAKTSELRRQIAARKDTALEGITQFLRNIMDKLPDLIPLLLKGAGRMLGLPDFSAQRRAERKRLDDEWES